mgnify:CR=1 FL=1
MNYKGKQIKARYQSFKENELVEYKFDRIPINDIFDLDNLEYKEQIALMHICRKYKYDLHNQCYEFKLNGSSLARLCNNKKGNNGTTFNNMIMKFINLNYLIDDNCSFYEIDFNYINTKANEFREIKYITNNINY